MLQVHNGGKGGQLWAMGYGLCGSAALGALAPWRRGGAVCLSFGSCVYEARGADVTRAVYVQARQRLTGRTKERDARTPSHTVELPFQALWTLIKS